MQHLEPNKEHLKVLQETFHCPKFKKDQWSAMRSIMYDRRDTSIVASTGFGKSLIFQYPPVFLDQIAFVVSPLIALMQDQVQSLTERGIKATYICHLQPDKQIPQKFGQFNVVYVTPESLLRDSWTGKQVQKGIKKVLNRVCMFAIDEAHVVHSWSDFRSEYKELYKLRDMFPGIPIVTLTATCPLYVEKIINDTLKLQRPFALRLTLNRPNLFFEAHPKQKGVCDFLPYLQNHTKGNAIVYVITRADAEKYAEELNQKGIECKPYHSEIQADERKETLLAFRAGKLKTVVCTIAFGMGIDRKDVRLVIHYGMPRTIEGYYQEAGRAGRDGEKSKCVLFHSQDDYVMHCFFIENPNHDEKRPPKPVSEEFKQEQYKLLDIMREFTTSLKCRRIEMLEYLGAEPTEYKNLTIHKECCDNCLRDCSGMGNIPLNLMHEPSNGLDTPLKKKENVEFFWNGNKIESRPKVPDQKEIQRKKQEDMEVITILSDSEDEILVMEEFIKNHKIDESSQQTKAQDEEIRKMEKFIKSEDFKKSLEEGSRRPVQVKKRRRYSLDISYVDDDFTPDEMQEMEKYMMGDTQAI